MGTALVTGPTTGLGKEFAVQLAARGHDLVLVSRDEAALTRTAESITSRHRVDVEVLPADLSELDDCRRVEARLADADRPIEWLVNNAGFGLNSGFTRTSVDDEQQLLDVLVRAPMRLTHAALPGMIERGRGRVVVVSSVAGWMASGTYSAAKAWATVFSEGLSAELAGTGVAVTAVCPGFVHTEFHQRAGMDMSKVPDWMWLNAPQVVAAGLRDAQSGQAVSVPSAKYKGISTLVRVLPRPLVRRLR